MSPIQPNIAGVSDAFVAKIDITNRALRYCTYLGGGNAEGLLYAGIAVDQAGSAYITGFTRSSDFPTTTTAYQKTFGGGDRFGTPLTDAFVAKISDAVPPTINTVKYKAGGAKLIISGERFNLAAHVFVDGQQVEPKSIEQTLIVVKKLFLQPGTHEIQVENPDGVKAVYRLIV